MIEGARRRVARTVIGLAAALALAAPPARAADDLFISGFVSQGYLNSEGNSYLIENSEKGSAEFSEVALVVYSNPLDRLRVGLQLLARDFGQVGNNTVILDWAFGDYRWRDELGVRAGKVRLPFGLYNHMRDVDIARDQILLPQSVYDERLRDLVLAYEGASLYGHLPVGGFGALDYEAWAGTFNVPDVSRGYFGRFLEDVAVGAIPGLKEALLPPGTTALVNFRGVTDPTVTLPWAFGATLFWETPVDGLRAGLTGVRTRIEGDVGLLYDVAVLGSDPTALPEVFRADIPTGFEFDVDLLGAASVEWAANRWTLAAEYILEDIEGNQSDGWYGLASYQLTDRGALSASYSESYADRDNRDGDGFAIPAAAFQKDLGAGIRWDLTPNWRVKYEHHFVDGLEQVDGADLMDADPADFEKHWSYFLLKTTFQF